MALDELNVADHEAHDVLNANKALDIQAEIEHYHSKETIQKDPAMYERFYLALTGCWLNVEARRLALISANRLKSEKLALWSSVASLRSKDKDTPNTFHMIEVYDFVYIFLVQELSCWRADTYRDWFRPQTRNEDSWAAYFEICMRLTFSPPDIIELLLLTPIGEGKIATLNGLWIGRTNTCEAGLP